MILKDNVPIHEQIKEDIYFKIEQGYYKAGQKIQSERELAEIYGVSRVTIRQALSELVNRGVLQKKLGSGTYIRDTKIEHSLLVLTGIVDELKQSGLHVSIVVNEEKYMTYSAAKKNIWDKLKVNKTEKVYMIERLLLANNEVLLIDYNYFPESIGNSLENFDFKKDVIYKGLESIGYQIDHADEKVSATIPNKVEKRLLMIDDSTAILRVERVVYSKKEAPLVLSSASFRGDKYTYSVRINRA